MKVKLKYSKKIGWNIFDSIIKVIDWGGLFDNCIGAAE